MAYEDPMAAPFVLNQKIPLLVELDRLTGSTGLNSGVMIELEGT